MKIKTITNKEVEKIGLTINKDYLIEDISLENEKILIRKDDDVKSWINYNIFDIKSKEELLKLNKKFDQNSIIVLLAKRYKNLIGKKEFGEGDFSKDHILKMLTELEFNSSGWSFDKSNRWLGYIQGVLTVFGIISVKEERRITRDLYHVYYKKYGIDIISVSV